MKELPTEMLVDGVNNDSFQKRELIKHACSQDHPKETYIQWVKILLSSC